MQNQKLSSLIVEPSDEEDAYGIVTETDIVYGVTAREKDPEQVRVHQIMTKPCIVVNPDLSIANVARLFAETGIQKAPVIKDKLLGIISVTDILLKIKVTPLSSRDILSQRIGVDPGHPFPHISNLSFNVAVVVKNPKTEEECFARVKVPDILPRFVKLPQELLSWEEGKYVWMGVPLEQVLAHNLSLLFPGLVIQEYSFFRVTRDADFPVQEDEADDLLLAIKMTLYRTSGDSPIIKALITAAEARKQVAALVELKARFDEEKNIIWARKLEDAGVHVVYGLVGLKTHTKILLVVRREGQEIRRYVHIGTGNYNSQTAKLYTDLGLLSCRQELGADLGDLFNFLTGYSQQQTYRKLLIAPVNLRTRLVAMIRREIEHSRQGRSGKIIAKMNALVDPEIIATLYEASQAGVQIDLIVRGICCLRPGWSGVSENIRVISIVGRYLEHSRIFYFHNDAQEEIYLGSADWMPRNLDRRVEAITPVEEPSLVNKLKEIHRIIAKKLLPKGAS